MKKYFLALKDRLKNLSFRTGVIVLSLCVPFYILSFAQALLPIGVAWKGALWVVFFGMAKSFQYAGLLILGKEGWRRLRAYFRTRREERCDSKNYL